jgi:hypothetical protein
MGNRAYILLPREVIAVLRRFSVLFFENSILSAIRSSCSTATAHARSKQSEWDEFPDRGELRSAQVEHLPKLPAQDKNASKYISRRSHTNDTSRSVTDLVVLAFRQLNEKFGDLVLDLHLAEDRRTIVRHGDIAVRRDENLVKAFMNNS